MNSDPKFGREYVLTVGVGPYGPPVSNGGATQGISFATQHVVITDPYTLEFDVRREFQATAQSATLKLKNLKETTRNVLYKDRFSTGLRAQVVLQAGYRDSFLSTIFSGSVWAASSYRYSRRDFVTEIEAFDDGVAYGNAFTSITLPPSHDFRDAVTRLNGDLGIGTSKTNPDGSTSFTPATPIIGSVPKTLGPRSTVLVGPTMNVLSKLLPPGVTATIDTGTLKVLADTDVLQFGNDVFVISAATGLLDPPQREGTMINVRMLFEPRLTIGQKVQLISVDNSLFNGFYQIRGISHFGIISAAEGGAAFTTLNLYLGPGLLKVLSGAISSPT